MQIGLAQQASEYASMGLLQVYANDTNTDHTAAIRTHLKNRNEANFRYMLIDNYLAQGDVASAQSELTAIMTECELSDDAEQEYNGMVTWYGVIDGNLTHLNDLDAADISILMNLAQEPNDYRASGLARGLLELNNAAIDYTEPVVFPGQNSSKKAVELVERPTTLARHFGLSPNPTKGKVTLEWLKTELYPAELLTIRILDVQGKLLEKKTGIKLDLQREVLNLSTLKNGTYLIEVRSNDQLLFNEKVVLQK